MIRADPIVDLTVKFNKRSYAIVVIAFLGVTAMLFLVFYGGPLVPRLMALVRASLFAIPFGVYGCVLDAFTKLEVIEGRSLVYRETFHRPRVVTLSSIKAITYVVGGFRDELHVLYKNDCGAEDVLKVNLNLFRREDITRAVEALVAMNATITRR